jgi:hypothetical protein
MTATATERRHGELIIHGLTGRTNGAYWFIFQIGDGPVRELADLDVAKAIRPVFDLTPVTLAGETLMAEDVIELYQYAIRALTAGELICHHHNHARLGPDGSCPTCINEQTENDR